ncbi:DUF4215 domain-containing protein [Sorangium sp. So ce131]|uniref:DUF4215 domain-containing protein n=1 Tax=Sorangium sp. So ce131 TaxID=3133282 RepID=UPI003F646C58
MPQTTRLIGAIALGASVAAGCGGGGASGAVPPDGVGGTGSGGDDSACGDGALANAEACDDGNTSDGDGCSAACSVEPGYECTGAPSDCAAVCGDGLLAGGEACDDGDTSDGDGCSAACAPEPGYDCTGEPSACASSCGDGALASDEACDDGNTSDGDGCSAACAPEPGYDCTGEPSACAARCGDGVILDHEGCDDGDAASGDGCSSGCQIETGFVCSGAPSLCCIPEAEPNNEPSAASGPVPVGAMACGSISPDGEVDVYAFTLPTAGDVFVEAFNGADPGSCSPTAAITLYDGDGVTVLTRGATSGAGRCARIDGWADPRASALPAGTYYVEIADAGRAPRPAYTVRIRATVCGDGVQEGSEACDGEANCDERCEVTTPGPGESMQTAEPFPGCPLAPSSKVRGDVPPCLPVSGAVHWYSHAATSGVVVLSADAAGPVALFSDTGQMIGCSPDVTERPIASRSTVGQVFYAAIPASPAGPCVSFTDLPYAGVGAASSDLGVAFPSSAAGSWGMTTSATHVFLATAAKVFSFQKSVGVTALEVGASNGITSAHMGYDIQFANGALFSVDQTNSATSSRIFRIFDEAAGTWAPTTWDTSPAYPGSSPSYALTFDGTDLLYPTRGNDTTPAYFFARSPAEPGPAQLLGSVPALSGVAGMAADARHLYIAASHAGRPGIYRLDRADMAAPPVHIAEGDISATNTSVVVDDTTAASYLYFRDAVGDVRVVADPGGTPLELGVLSTLGSAEDRAMTYDAAANTIYLYETETNAAGRVVMLR